MAEMIPDYIDQEDPRRNGERMVFEWLSDSRIPGTAYYSVLQKNHQNKLIGEVDFLYVSERGMICIEVKGGQEICRDGREWFSVNRLGMRHPIRNPFVQAKDCQYALKGYLSQVYGKYSDQAKYLVGYAVIFPECRFTGKGNDLVTEVMYDTRYELKDFPDFINEVYDYWEAMEEERHSFIPERLNHLQLRQINDLLRGDFHVVPSMYLEFQHIEQQMIRLTEEQYDVLESVEENERSIIRGGAGTGKTLLALQLARKCTAQNKKVLYLCFNNNMAQCVRFSLRECTEVKVSTYSALIMELLDDYTLYKKSVSELSRLLKEASIAINEKYDVIIIDEGQDLFLMDVFDVLDMLLLGGIERGCWTVFLDPNQNIFHAIEDYELTIEYIRETCHPILLKLNTNCRNTKEIAMRTAAVTITPPEKNLKLNGPKVMTRTYRTNEEFISLITKEIKSLFTSGISAKDIVILSRKKKVNSSLSNLNDLCGLEIIEQTDVKKAPYPCLNYYTVQSFKGLESKVVFYIEPDGFLKIEDRMLNYVGMSRAKFMLYVFYDKRLKDEYEETLDQGMELLV